MRMSAKAKRFHILLLLLALGGLLLSGCAPTEETIETWADSQNGARMIAEAIADSSLPVKTRSYALQKLIVMQEPKLAYDGLKRCPENERLAILKNAGEEIGKLIEHEDMKIQSAAKDFLYLLLGIENEIVKDSAIQILLKWYSDDFGKRYGLGQYSAVNVFKAIGARAQDTLVAIMKNEKDKKTRKRLAIIIEKIDDPVLTQKIGSLLAKELESTFDNPELLLFELARYVRDEQFTALLNRFVSDKRNSFQYRKIAADALTHETTKLSLPVGINLFIDESEHPALRARGVEIIRKAGDESALQYLYPVLKNPDLCWLTFDAIIGIGGVDVFPKAIEALDEKQSMKNADVVRVEKAFQSHKGEKALSALAPFLKSENAIQVAVALLGLQWSADSEFAEQQIQPLFEDEREIAGLKKKKIGRLAQEIFGKIEKRKTKPKNK